MEIRIDTDSIVRGAQDALRSCEEFVKWGVREVSRTWNEDWLPLIQKVGNSFKENITTLRLFGVGMIGLGIFSFWSSYRLYSRDPQQGKINISHVASAIFLAAGAAMVIFGGPNRAAQA